jgi:prepilin-type processing-associated H-X9-DG protein
MTNQNSKMSGTEKVEQGQKPKTSKLALLSLVLPVLGFCIALRFATLGLVRFFGGILFIEDVPIIGFVLGVVALVKIGNSNGKIAGRVLATLGISAAAISLYFVCLPMTLVKRPPPLMICKSHLHRLGITMRMYANDFDGKYPITDKWSDLLLKHGEGKLTEKSFKCPANKKERCSFAMNPNCEPNSPVDMVLLFETKGGWNQFGGSEILTLENHRPKGCNILFNDGHVEFVKPEQISKLKWKVE